MKGDRSVNFSVIYPHRVPLLHNTEYQGGGQGRDQKLEAEAKILASRIVWPSGFNITAVQWRRYTRARQVK